VTLSDAEKWAAFIIGLMLVAAVVYMMLGND
jgi:hypothetical protein